MSRQKRGGRDEGRARRENKKRQRRRGEGVREGRREEEMRMGRGVRGKKGQKGEKRRGERRGEEIRGKRRREGGLERRDGGGVSSRHKAQSGAAAVCTAACQSISDSGVFVRLRGPSVTTTPPRQSASIFKDSRTGSGRTGWIRSFVRQRQTQKEGRFKPTCE